MEIHRSIEDIEKEEKEVCFWVFEWMNRMNTTIDQEMIEMNSDSD